jgi:hypothetical protein
MSILSTTKSGKSSVIISEEFLRKQNWRKYASWDNIFVPAHFDSPVTFIQVNKFLDSKYNENKIFFARMHDLESGIRYVVLLFNAHDYDLFVDYEFNHKRKSLDELISKTGIVLPYMSTADARLLDNGYFPSVLEKDIERLLNKRK